MRCCSYQLYRLFQTPHSFSVTFFTLVFLLFFILMQINLLSSPPTTINNTDTPYIFCLQLSLYSFIHNKQPPPPRSCMYIGYHNLHWQSLPKSARLTYLNVYHRRDDTSESTPSPSPPSSLTDVHNIQTPTLPIPILLTFTCTQVLWFLSSLTRSRASDVTIRPDTRITIISTRPTQCM